MRDPHWDAVIRGADELGVRGPQGSADYALFRPSYPAELAEFLADHAPGRQRALDCGCGSGQLTRLLASHFAEVVGTDASANQVELAEPLPNVTYRAAPAESSGLEDASVDAVTVAQAAHWFDLPSFYAEVRRVLRANGLVALVTYGIIETDGKVGEALSTFYHNIVGHYWPPERRHVEAGYRTLPFPFREVIPPAFAMRASWTLAQLLGYIDTWSAMRAAEKALGRQPLETFAAELAGAWGDPQTPREIRWPLSLRVGHI